MANYSDDGDSYRAVGAAASKKVLAKAYERDFTSLSPDILKEAVSKTSSSRDALRQFYKIQSLQTLGEKAKRVMIPVWISPGNSKYTKVASAWIEHLQRAISDINFAAPGLYLYTTDSQPSASIKIAGIDKKRCYTRGNYILSDRAEIYLYHKWNDMKRTSCHELLHAVGFHHEHQRGDRDPFVHVKTDDPSYQKSESILGLTRLDPFSIMLYPEDQKKMSRNSDDAVWFTKPSRELNREMSELDKVGLNNLYRPCEGPQYSPTKYREGVTGLWYCGRYFGVQRSTHDGVCGPDNGPNCPACRVLKSDRVEELRRIGKWQGWTGEVYCGRYFGVQSEGHDGYCGPNNGPSCPECFEEVFKGA